MSKTKMLMAAAALLLTAAVAQANPPTGSIDVCHDLGLCQQSTQQPAPPLADDYLWDAAKHSDCESGRVWDSLKAATDFAASHWGEKVIWVGMVPNTWDWSDSAEILNPGTDYLALTVSFEDGNAQTWTLFMIRKLGQGVKVRILTAGYPGSTGPFPLPGLLPSDDN